MHILGRKSGISALPRISQMRIWCPQVAASWHSWHRPGNIQNRASIPPFRWEDPKNLTMFTPNTRDRERSQSQAKREMFSSGLQRKLCFFQGAKERSLHPLETELGTSPRENRDFSACPAPQG